MTNMHESFFTVAKHFSNHRPLIQPLFCSSPVFRETCMDYHKCGEALQHWLESDSDQAVMLEIMLCDEKGQYVWGCSDRRMASIISLTSMQMAKRCLNSSRYFQDWRCKRWLNRAV